MKIEDLKCAMCRRFPQAAEDWHEERVCPQCLADARLGRMVRAMPMNKALHRGLGRWCLEGDAWSATPEEALEKAGVKR